MSRSDDDNWLALLIAVPVGLVLSVLLRGLVLVQLWAWFVVPLHAPQVTFWHAMGLSTLVSLATWSGATPKADKERSNAMLAVMAVGVPVLAYGLTYVFAWVYHSMMVG